MQFFFTNSKIQQRQEISAQVYLLVSQIYAVIVVANTRRCYRPNSVTFYMFSPKKL